MKIDYLEIVPHFGAIESLPIFCPSNFEMTDCPIDRASLVFASLFCMTCHAVLHLEVI